MLGSEQRFPEDGHSDPLESRSDLGVIEARARTTVSTLQSEDSSSLILMEVLPELSPPVEDPPDLGQTVQDLEDKYMAERKDALSYRWIGFAFITLSISSVALSGAIPVFEQLYGIDLGAFNRTALRFVPTSICATLGFIFLRASFSCLDRANRSRNALSARRTLIAANGDIEFAAKATAVGHIDNTEIPAHVQQLLCPELVAIEQKREGLRLAARRAADTRRNENEQAPEKPQEIAESVLEKALALVPRLPWHTQG